LLQPHQRPDRSGKETHQWNVGLGEHDHHAKRQGALDCQYREQGGSGVSGRPVDDVGQQDLGREQCRDPHEPDPERGITENRRADPDEPGNHRRMVEKADDVFLRPCPVIRLIGLQLEGCREQNPAKCTSDDDCDNYPEQ
jgi:hypothetical protein